MGEALWRAVTPAGEQFIAEVAKRPEATLLGIDFDGTLAPMVPNPRDSRLHEGSATALGTLVARLGQVAIITGRPVATVRELARLDERPELADLGLLGQYGVERYDPSTGETRRPDEPEGVAAATAELHSLLGQLAVEGWATEGALVEEKGLAVAIHTRQAGDPDGLWARLAEPVAEIALRRGLHLEPGRLVHELRAARHDKGDALLELVRESRPGVVAMIGDDLGDLPALQLLATLRREGLLTCAVVSHSAEQPILAEVADVLCAGPDGVAEWLGDLVAAINSAGDLTK